MKEVIIAWCVLFLIYTAYQLDETNIRVSKLECGMSVCPTKGIK